MPEYIEREWLLDLYDESKLTEKEKSYGVPFNIVRQGILDAPAVDAAPVVHGRWVSWEEADNFIPSPDRHECSVCHDAAQVLVNGLELLSDYCPNCGAKMDGEP